MANHRAGKTIVFPAPPIVLGTYCQAGPREGAGPMADYFDAVLDDPMLGEQTAEKAERHLLEDTAAKALAQASLQPDDIQYYIAGDLLNQIVAAGFSARTLGIPFVGLYGACSVFAEALALGSVLIHGSCADKVMVASSSHYQSAERQFRYPIELNTQRKQTSQMTVTGAGAAILGNAGSGLYVTSATLGRVIDMGCKQGTDLGSAMAPAAWDTLQQHLTDTGQAVTDYDLIMTGDLGTHGKKMLTVLAEQQDVDLSSGFEDGGDLIFSTAQHAGAGGSGCACAALMTCGYLYRTLTAGIYERVLLVATGALLNQMTEQQGETIPCIAHAVALERSPN